MKYKKLALVLLVALVQGWGKVPGMCLTAQHDILIIKPLECRPSIQLQDATAAAWDRDTQYKFDWPDHVRKVLTGSPGAVLRVEILHSRHIIFWPDSSGEVVPQPGEWKDADEVREYFYRSKGQREPCSDFRLGEKMKVFVGWECCDYDPPSQVTCLLKMKELFIKVPRWARQFAEEPVYPTKRD